MFTKNTALVLAFLGALVMTMPGVNSGGLDLPAAITAVPESSTITRVGVVSDIVESDNITVRISGAPTLVRASYLFPQYQPMLGDNVIVTKQDAQWLVLGTSSGPINSIAANPSFELGTPGSLPTDWTFTNTDVSAGTPTFLKQPGINPLIGKFIGHLQLTPTGINVSSSTITSARVPASEGGVWTGAVSVYIIDLVGPNSMLFSTMITWYDVAGVAITSSVLASVVNFSSSTPGWVLLRPNSSSPSVAAPAGTAFAALSIDVLFTCNDSGTLFDAYLDGAILRRVTPGNLGV